MSNYVEDWQGFDLEMWASGHLRLSPQREQRLREALARKDQNDTKLCCLPPLVTP